MPMNLFKIEMIYKEFIWDKTVKFSKKVKRMQL